MSTVAQGTLAHSLSVSETRIGRKTTAVRFVSVQCRPRGCLSGGQRGTSQPQLKGACVQHQLLRGAGHGLLATATLHENIDGCIANGLLFFHISRCSKRNTVLAAYSNFLVVAVIRVHLKVQRGRSVKRVTTEFGSRVERRIIHVGIWCTALFYTCTQFTMCLSQHKCQHLLRATGQSTPAQ